MEGTTSSDSGGTMAGSSGSDVLAEVRQGVLVTGTRHPHPQHAVAQDLPAHRANTDPGPSVTQVSLSEHCVSEPEDFPGVQADPVLHSSGTCMLVAIRGELAFLGHSDT